MVFSYQSSSQFGRKASETTLLCRKKSACLKEFTGAILSNRNITHETSGNPETFFYFYLGPIVNDQFSFAVIPNLL